jgi:5'-nucleotidase
MMNILVTNDDGIESPGIWALAEVLSKIGDVLIVAPDKQQSGVGTSVSFMRDSVTVKEVPSRIPHVKAFSVSGTPSDCVILGIRRITTAHVDLLVSGINLGPNVGNDIPYSGTVMATLAGYFRKIPSIAVSLAFKDRNEQYRFDIAAKFTATLVEAIEKGQLKTDVIINVNVPNIPSEKIKGILATRAAGFGYVRLSKSKGTSQDASFDTIIGKPDSSSLEEGTDVWAVGNGYISITPLHLDVTHHELIPTIAECVEGMNFDYLGK